MRLRHNPLTFALLAASVLAGCGGSTTITRTIVQPTPTSPTWIPQSSFTVSTTGNAAATMALPSGGGFSGSVSTAATLQQYTQATRMLSDEQPQVAPLARTKQDVPSDAVLVYAGLNFDANVPASTLSLTLQIPQAAYVPGARYYLALLDPLRPTLGWQHGFAGPAAISMSGSTPALSFTAASAPQFVAFEQYWLAAYMLASGAQTPTPAPSISPQPAPTQQPGTIVAIQTQLSKDNSCSGTPCATGPIPAPTQGPQNYNVFPNVADPSLSGASTQLQFQPNDNAEGDVLYYTPPLADYPLATQFTWDFWFRVDQDVWSTDTRIPGDPEEMNALEFDFNKGMPGTPGYNYNFSSQCYMGDPAATNGPVWEIWGNDGSGGTNHWVQSGMPCDPETWKADTWHHIVWQYRIHPDTLTAEYLTLTVDGETMTPTQNATHSVDELHTQAHRTLEVQFQQDARSRPTPLPFNEWVDNVMLSYQ